MGMVILFMIPYNLLNKFIGWADFLHADYDAIIFYSTNIALVIFGF